MNPESACRSVSSPRTRDQIAALRHKFCVSDDARTVKLRSSRFKITERRLASHGDVVKTSAPQKGKGGGPGLPASLYIPFRGVPTSLTEGGQPVVCWLSMKLPKPKKSYSHRKKSV